MVEPVKERLNGAEIDGRVLSPPVAMLVA